MTKFAAVLLAGGQSRRMGVDKALLDYHGTPLWRLQMEKLAQLGPGQLLFSVRQDMEFPSGPWRLIHDRLANMGPLGGLEAALRLTSEQFLVALAVDMPAMTTKFLSTLLEKAGPAGVVPHFNGFYHGASAVYPVGILPLVERVLQSEDRSFQHLIRKALPLGIMKAQEIEPAKCGLFENWNSPDDI